MDKRNDQPKGWGTWVLGHSLALVTILGVVLYGAIRLSYAIYYGKLGLTPEEVGLGYAEILARSTMGVVVLIMLLGLTTTVYAALLILLVALRRGRRARSRARRGISSSSPPSSLADITFHDALSRFLFSRLAAIAWAVVAVVILFVLLPLSASFAASDLRNGQGGEALSFGPFVVLDVRSAPATILSASDVSEEILSDRCLAYLGQSDGVVTLFDVDRSAVVKIAQADAIVEIGTSSGGRFSVDC